MENAKIFVPFKPSETNCAPYICTKDGISLQSNTEGIAFDITTIVSELEKRLFDINSVLQQSIASLNKARGVEVTGFAIEEQAEKGLKGILKMMDEVWSNAIELQKGIGQ